MTVYTVLGQDDENLRVTLTEATGLVTLDINPASLTITGGGDVSSVNGQTGAVVLDTDDIDEGDTNLYYTAARVQSVIDANTADFATVNYVDTSVANLVDTAPETLDTLNELAAALGDDPDFATTVSTQLGLKLNTADFDSTADAWLTGKTTTDLTEGTNLYYTDQRVDDYLQSGNVTLIDIDGYTLTADTVYGTLDLAYPNGETLQIGQEQHFYAKATEAIAAGDAVMFAGAQGDHILIALADQSSPGYRPQFLIGVATQDFANNEFGYVASFGRVVGIKTDYTGWAEGTLLWLDPNTPGKFVTTEPTPPDHIQLVAAVTRVHSNQGTILVRPSHTQDTDETPEGVTNLYYTDARVDTLLATKGYATTAYVDSQISSVDLTNFTTDDLTEGSNLYYTDARVDTHLNTSTATTNQVLTWTGSDYSWAEAAGGASELTDLTDVSLSALEDGDLLMYNGTAGEWQNTNLGISIAPILDIPDIYDNLDTTITITNHGDYDDPNYYYEIVDTSDVLVVGNAGITDNHDGTFTIPGLSAGNYKIRVKTQDFGDIASEFTIEPFTVQSLFGWTTRYIRITDFITTSDPNDMMVAMIAFFTGASQTGTRLPPFMTSATDPAPFVISSNEPGFSGYEPWKAFDNSTSTYFWTLSTSGPAFDTYLDIDLGAEYTINSMYIRNGNSIGDWLTRFTIYTSDTGAFAGEEVKRETLPVIDSNTISDNYYG